MKSSLPQDAMFDRCFDPKFWRVVSSQLPSSSIHLRWTAEIDDRFDPSFRTWKTHTGEGVKSIETPDTVSKYYPPRSRNSCVQISVRKICTRALPLCTCDGANKFLKRTRSRRERNQDETERNTPFQGNRVIKLNWKNWKLVPGEIKLQEIGKM